MQVKATQTITFNICFKGPRCSLKCEALQNCIINHPKCEAFGTWLKVLITENREIKIIRCNGCVNKYGLDGESEGGNE